ncbi:MAG: aminopeptidase P N-terminal domain-containing protein [Candidatus Eremiobacteraeota bacterium]|nr:aminopeptidase P N-terminal domain-containing protein [Candidatus Eremiobacteraeota bacterium]
MTEFKKRRDAFMEKIGDAVAVFPSAPQVIRSNDGHYPYRQDSDFYYLTGFAEPESVLVLAPSHPQTKTVIFVRPRDRDREIWEGKRLGVEAAAAALSVDAAYPLAELDERLPALLDGSDNLYYGMNGGHEFIRRIIRHVKQARITRRRADNAALNILDPSPILHEMRTIKSAADIAGMRRAVEISCAGHLAAMRYARPGMHEYEVQAIVDYVFASRGAESNSYPSIVAGGNNTTYLHYTANRDRIPDDALVLIDAGAEVDFYNGDITRTWPISGKFSAEQRAVYDIVLAANRAAIELCKPGVTFNTTINDAAQRIMVEGLIDLKLVKGSADAVLEGGAHRPFLPHRVGHFLGYDTHDVGFYRQKGDWRPLAAGMVVTIEPGLYVGYDLDVDPRFKGIGVRIEDDVLVTERGRENLSEELPKDADEIERTMEAGRRSKEPLLA